MRHTQESVGPGGSPSDITSAMLNRERGRETGVWTEEELKANAEANEAKHQDWAPVDIRRESFIEHGDGTPPKGKKTLEAVQVQNNQKIAEWYQHIEHISYNTAEKDGSYDLIRETLEKEHKNLKEAIERNNDKLAVLFGQARLLEIESKLIGLEMHKLGKQMWEMDNSDPRKAELQAKWDELKQNQVAIDGQVVSALEAQINFLIESNPEIAAVRAVKAQYGA